MAKLHYHPEYRARVGRWRDYLDATDPDDYIFPRAGKGLTGFADDAFVAKDEAGVQAAIGRIVSADGTTATALGGLRATRVLRHRGETAAAFANRLQLTVHYLVGDGLCDLIARHACGAHHEKSEARLSSPLFQEHERRATEDGQSRDAYMRELIYWMVIFGACHTYAYDKGAAPDLADGSRSQKAGRSAYLQLVTPIDLVDWADGEVTIREWWQPPHTFGEPIPDPEPRFRTIGLDSIVVRRVKGGGREVEGAELEEVSTEARKGPLPFVTCYFRDKSTCPHPIGDGAMRLLEPIDRSLLNLGSHRDDFVINSCFPVRFAPNEALSQGAKIGNATWVGLMPGDPPPAMLATDKAAFDALTELINERVQMAKNVLGLGRGRAEESIAARGAGEALIEREDKHGLLKDVVAQLERASNAIDRAWWQVQTGTEFPESFGATSYAHAFDGARFEADLEGVLERVFKLGVPPVAELEAKRYLGRSVIGRYTEKQRQDEVLGDLEDWAEKQRAQESAPPSEKPQPLALGVEATAAIVGANDARARMGLDPSPVFGEATVAEVMARNATVIAEAQNAAAGRKQEEKEEEER